MYSTDDKEIKGKILSEHQEIKKPSPPVPSGVIITKTEDSLGDYPGEA